MKLTNLCLIALLCAEAAAWERGCQHGQTLGSAKRALASEKRDLARRLKAQRKAKAEAKAKGAEVLVAGPGAGADAETITPYETIYKDGYFSLGCKRDDMYFSADKHSDQGGHRYAAAFADVSIIWYHEMVDKLDRDPMTPDVCYDFCRTIPQMGFFGLMAGRECYCTPYHKEGVGGEDSDCDLPCEGDNAQVCGGDGKSNLYEMHLCDDTAEDMAKAASAADSAFELSDGEATKGEEAAEKMTKLGDELETEASLAGDASAVAHAKAAKVFGGEVERAAEASRKAADALKAVIDEAPADGTSFTDAQAIRDAEDVMDRMGPATKAADEAGDASEAQNAQALPPVGKDAKYLDGYYPVTYYTAPKANRDDKSTCAGTASRKPAVGLSKEGCAAACEAAVFPPANKCAFFQFYEKSGGESLCFLLSAVEMVSYYTCPSDLMQKAKVRGAKKTAKKESSIPDAYCYAKVSEAKGFSAKTSTFQRCW